MNKKWDKSNSALTDICKRCSLLILGLFIMVSPAQADPPRELHTSFDHYVRQQQQHDQKLAQHASATAKASSNSNAATSSSQNAAASKRPGSSKSSSPVNINTADEISLSNTLIGIGPAKARAIVAYRQQNGKFKQPEDLLAVKGIGPATLEKNRDRIRLN